ncbi:MAG: hypothetical protein EKK41_19830 [Hyphomicrobiales bacterium]|nr:MAG: hypothetical protein EKK41_19830 [Hyphomicrobiales bacterium]
MHIHEYTIAPLARHEAGDYVAHLQRLDSVALARRFGGHLSREALAERADLAVKRAALIVVARFGAEIRAAVEFWHMASQNALEIAVSIEAAPCKRAVSRPRLEADLLAEGTAHLGMPARLLNYAHPAEPLPHLPKPFVVSSWRPWTDPDVWCCELDTTRHDIRAEGEVQPLHLRSIHPLPDAPSPLAVGGRGIATTVSPVPRQSRRA